jgi:hypothetical protein
LAVFSRILRLCLAVRGLHHFTHGLAFVRSALPGTEPAKWEGIQIPRGGRSGLQTHIAPTAQAPQCSTQRAGIAPPHAEGDELSGVTGERESNAFISGPAAFVGGMPLTRARNP